MKPLDFKGEKRMLVYKCTHANASLAWKRHLPKAPILAFSALTAYKLFIAYTSFIWPILPLPGILLFATIQRNLNENCES